MVRIHLRAFITSGWPFLALIATSNSPAIAESAGANLVRDCSGPSVVFSIRNDGVVPGDGCRSLAVSRSANQVLAQAASSGNNPSSAPARGRDTKPEVAQAEPNGSPRQPSGATRQSIEAAKAAAGSKSLQDIKKSLGMKEGRGGEMAEIPSEVLFSFDSDRLRPEAVNILAECAEMIRRDGNKSLHVVGHTDSAGPASYNLNLSRRRAEAVTNWLVTEGGIPKEYLVSKGEGPNKPKVSNDTVSGRMKNRRVEVVMPMGMSPHHPMPDQK